ncbi:MAG: hypothetical protein SFW36_15835 [Leptolyngbyaceae cyanobacterium bins.59]|nr:hypothetical protein [Leptolyngbyaceae cyanobacterium bins.59]
MELEKEMVVEQKVEELKQKLEARLSDSVEGEPSELSDLDLEAVVGGGTDDCQGGGG